MSWTPEQISEKQKSLIQNIQRLGDVEALEFTDFRQRDGLIYPLLYTLIPAKHQTCCAAWPYRGMTGPRKRYRNWICDPHADRHSRVGARWWGVDIGYGGEPLLIPINMRDGSLLCVGRGNED